MINYVVGFLFDKKGKRVALVLKNRPAWQKGRLNGIGGKMEGNESVAQAMSREFKEETGVYIPPKEWKVKVALTHSTHYRVYFLYAFSDKFDDVETVTDEVIYKYGTKGMTWRTLAMPSLNWLIPLCLDTSTDDHIIIDQLEETI